MKLAAAALVVSSLTATTKTVSAFVPSRPSSKSASTTGLAVAAAVATSFEEDLALTLKVILDHEARSTTATKDQMLSQMKQAEETTQKEEPMDISIPYNAAALLAYQKAGNPDDFATFEANYIKETVAMVTAKKAERDGALAQKKTQSPPAAKPAEKAPVAIDDAVADISIPYDAAARLAYAASNQKMDYASFQLQYEADARSAVMAKGDLSVPYDAAALEAYASSNRKIPYELFVEQYKADARSAVMAKGDLSVPYDAAALQAYTVSDRSVAFEDFKASYEAQAIAEVVAKKQSRESESSA